MNRGDQNEKAGRQGLATAGSFRDGLHDLQSRCASLHSGAQVLGDMPTERKKKLLTLMAGHVVDIARTITDLLGKCS